VVRVEKPAPGLATWEQGGNEQRLEIITVKGGWLVARQSNKYLCGIIWSQGSYYANVIEDAKTGTPCKTLRARGQRVRGTIQLDPENSEDLGKIII
jgi:hypothetical protein